MSPRTQILFLSLCLLLGLSAPGYAETYDPNGNLLTRPSEAGTFTYTYDVLDRLESESGPTINQSFTYDPNGNRESDGTNNYTIAPNGNHIQTINSITQTYDPAGNLLDDGQGQTYIYNAAGRLKEVKVNTVLVASYKYNYRGLRTHKTTPTGTTLYHYDRNGHLIQTTDQLGVPQQSLHWADDTPVAQVDHAGPTDQIAYLHTDHLNTPRYATDENQTVIWRWEGNAFGNTLPDEDPDGDGIPTTINLRLPGQYFDQESGLFYNWNRYYDPATGRYITSDPIGLDGGLNTYEYVSGNPLRYTDPLGLCPWCLVIPGICAGGGCEALGLGFLATGMAINQANNNSNDRLGSGSGPLGGGTGDFCLLFPNDPLCEGNDTSLCPTTPQQLQKKFKHASDFGIQGNFNPANAARFDRAIQSHVNNLETLQIRGTYRNTIPVTHFFNPKTGLNVMRGPTGQFLSGWRLGQAQRASLFRTGNIQ